MNCEVSHGRLTEHRQIYWIGARPNFSTASYFHAVFTAPDKIAAIAYRNKEVVYNILFQAAAETLRTIAADPKHLGAEIGFFAVLCSWGEQLDASSAPALRGSRRWALARRQPLRLLRAGLLPAPPPPK
jgi:hypothetical protein